MQNKCLSKTNGLVRFVSIFNLIVGFMAVVGKVDLVEEITTNVTFTFWFGYFLRLNKISLENNVHCKTIKMF